MFMASVWVLQLKPVRYAFKGNDTDTSPVNVEPHPSPAASGDPIVVPYRNSLHYKQARTGNEFIGLIAQDVEDVLPECIKMAAGFVVRERLPICAPLTQVRYCML